ncbi:lymphocyte antigen 6K isoform X1 [Pongo abelii]|uniref:lymphocyte antigen 6K isoform X1 n=1 Tax=Pongo abelii TaxID=9601 RepID=UPI0023E0B214|nr:lymphocyte antigen 6K isoform X1 [Pongo pygmaeus]
MALLALLLVVALPRVWTDANLTARQRDPEDTPQTDEGDNRVWCHVCERENTFECENPRRCQRTEPYCVIAAVRGSSGLVNSDSAQQSLSSPSVSTKLVGRREIFPRFFMISKQCSASCAAIERPKPEEKRFLLEEPLPFFYLKCCKIRYCNLEGPPINSSEFKEFAGSVGESCGGLGLAVLLLLASIAAGLSLS